MKKLLFSVIFICAEAVAGLAQVPTITNANMFNINEVSVQYRADSSGINPGPSGANVTWDFSNLKALAAHDSSLSTYLYPSSTPYPNDFPSANMATQSASGQSYAYWNYSGNTISLLGIEGQETISGQTTTLKIFYTKAEMAYSYPLTYNYNQTCSFAASNDVGGGNIYYLIGTQTVKGDGYGTLKIMGHTCTNVLRLHLLINEYDSFPGSGTNIYTTQESWSYVISGKKDAILIITEVTQQGQGTKSVTYNATGLETLENLGNEFNIFPNPAHTIANVGLNATHESNATLVVVNELGQRISEKNILLQSGKNTIPVSIAGLNSGLYFLSVRTEGNVVTRRFEIQ